MKPSVNCFNLLKAYEGCRLSAYVDPASGSLPITIGWGSTMRKDGSRFKLGDRITQQQADDLLEWEVNNKSIVLYGLIFKAGLNQNQFDALVSFVYNIGIAAFVKSTLLKMVKMNANDPDIPAEFGKWVYGSGKIMKGLINRRKAEAELYSTINLKP